MSIEALLVDWTRALGWTLIHTLWQGAVVAAAYAVFRSLARGRDVRLRYAGGLTALALLLLLPAATLWRLAPGAAPAAQALDAAGSAAAVISWTTTVEAWLPLVVAIWLAGVCLAGMRELWRWHAVRALLLGSATTLPDWTARAARIAQRLRVSRPVRVVTSTLALTPSLVGWIAPVIVLPASTLIALSPRQLEMVIAHELAHVRRSDYLVNLLQVAVETLLFHHPAVHWISRDVRELREACCDDLVLRSGFDPLHYADTLASLEELRGITHAPALAASGGSLLLRVRRIVGADRDAPVRADGPMVVLCAGLVALALMLAAPEPVSEPTPVAVVSLNANAALARSAVAAVETLVAPSAAVSAAPTTRGIEQASTPVASPAAPAQLVSPRVAAPAAIPLPPGVSVDLRVEREVLEAQDPVVADVTPRRQRVRPTFVIVNDPPINCVRALGSRLCRALPTPADRAVQAQRQRVEVGDAKSQLPNATSLRRQSGSRSP